jgi:hypothetical protein
MNSFAYLMILAGMGVLLYTFKMLLHPPRKEVK